MALNDFSMDCKQPDDWYSVYDPPPYETVSLESILPLHFNNPLGHSEWTEGSDLSGSMDDLNVQDSIGDLDVLPRSMPSQHSDDQTLDPFQEPIDSHSSHFYYPPQEPTGHPFYSHHQQGSCYTAFMDSASGHQEDNLPRYSTSHLPSGPSLHFMPYPHQAFQDDLQYSSATAPHYYQPQIISPTPARAPWITSSQAQYQPHVSLPDHNEFSFPHATSSAPLSYATFTGGMNTESPVPFPVFPSNGPYGIYTAYAPWTTNSGNAGVGLSPQDNRKIPSSTPAHAFGYPAWTETNSIYQPSIPDHAMVHGNQPRDSKSAMDRSAPLQISPISFSFSPSPKTPNFPANSDAMSLDSPIDDMPKQGLHSASLCYCQKPTGNDMLACSGPNHEGSKLFHLACAGLQVPPLDSKNWLCNECYYNKQPKFSSHHKKNGTSVLLPFIKGESPSSMTPQSKTTYHRKSSIKSTPFKSTPVKSAPVKSEPLKLTPLRVMPFKTFRNRAPVTVRSPIPEVQSPANSPRTVRRAHRFIPIQATSTPKPGSRVGVAKGKAWTAAEEKACIKLMREVKESGKCRRIDELWDAVATRLRNEYDINRSPAAVKNQWNRVLRAMSGFDERHTPKPSSLQTGLLPSSKKFRGSTTAS